MSNWKKNNWKKKSNQPKKPPTFFIKDYESFSTETKGGKISQFAGIRTDENFNIIEDGVNIFCKLSEDALPSPEACLITGITPQLIEQHQNNGDFEVYNENEFTQRIITQLGRGNTCTMGYNNFYFDDEVTRNLLFRNFRDPYSREWRGGNSRFDVYQLVMATYILRPHLLNFPPAKDPETGEVLCDPSGNPYPSFRLEELSVANGIVHENAHDALNDVKATIGVAKIIKDGDPEFFNKMFNLKNKDNVLKWFSTPISATETRENKPFVYTSSFFGREENFLGIMYKVADHPKNKNAIIAVNLRKNPENLVNLPVEEIERILYSKKETLEEENLERIGLQVIKINQCPMIEDLSAIKDRALELGLNGQELRNNIAIVKNNFSIIQNKIIQMFDKEYEKNPDLDVDMSLYAGDFFDNQDKKVFEDILNAARNGELKDFELNANDQRIPEMFFRFKGRNYPNQLGVLEYNKWEKHCINELTRESTEREEKKGTHYNFEKYYKTISELKEKYKDNNENLIILNKLEEYGARLEKRFKLKKNLKNNPRI